MLVIPTNPEVTKILRVYLVQPRPTQSSFQLVELKWKEISTMTVSELEKKVKWKSSHGLYWSYSETSIDNYWLFENGPGKQIEQSAVVDQFRNPNFPINIGCVLLQTIASNSTCIPITRIKDNFRKNEANVDTLDRQFLPEGVSQMGFLTCSGGQRGDLSWRGFVSAFD